MALGDVVSIQTLGGEVSRKLADAMAAGLGGPDGASHTCFPEEIGIGDIRFRASAIHKLCPREYGLMFLPSADGVQVVGENIDAGSRYVMAVGSAYHRAFQDELLPKLGILQGGWERPNEENGDLMEIVCGETCGPYTVPGRGWSPRPHGDGWRFVEPMGAIPDLRFSGHWDGVLVWDDGETEVLEIKTTRSELFAQVDPRVGGKPRPNHVMQCQCYMWMSGLGRARLVYVETGGSDLSRCIAEHVILRDDDAIARINLLIIECIEAMRTVKATGKVHPRGSDCRIKSDKRARACESRDVCFACSKAGI